MTCTCSNKASILFSLSDICTSSHYAQALISMYHVDQLILFLRSESRYFKVFRSVINI